MRLREMTWTDIPVLARLDAELFAHDAWTEPTWWAELAARPRRDYLVAVADDGLIGAYAGLDLGGDVADVMTIAVTAAYRGSGWGDRLLAVLVERATASGASGLMLEVRADNAPARRLYARHGFEQLSVRRRYYQPGDVDALVLRKQWDRAAAS
jgi:ribosomal-protein-alanine N-acetyltransferase